jgi:Icc protein
VTTLHFAHLTDIHITRNHQTWGTLGELSRSLLCDTIARLNTIPDLDFVLITGDVIDQATEEEIGHFNNLLARLEKPWHFVPGNHDGFIDPAHPDALPPSEAVARLDRRFSPETAGVQQATFSREVGAGVRLIGLDTRRSEDWSGEIGPAQLEWLEAELDVSGDDCVIIALHHPLHNLSPINTREWWSNFVCNNGAEIEVLLDRHPQVKLVISGHHHVQQLKRRGGRLHVCTAALTGYPCVYRLIRVATGGGGYHVAISTHSPADEEALKLNYDLMLEAKISTRYNPGDRTAWARFVAGKDADQSFEGMLQTVSA